MNNEKYTSGTAALSSRLPFALGWLVGDGEWAMRLARNACGHEWEDLFWQNGGLRPDIIDRVMAAWLTWRKIPVLEWLQPVVERAYQPPVPPPQPGTFGNVAVAQAAQSVAAPPQYGFSCSTPNRPGESDHGPPSLRDQYTRYPSSSSSSIWTQPRPWSTAGAMGALKPSRAYLLSPRQEHAAKRAALRYPPTPQHHPGSSSAPPQGATTGVRGNPEPPTKGENLRPEEPPSATNPQPAAAPSPTRCRNLRSPVPTRKRLHPLTPPSTGPPDWLTS